MGGAPREMLTQGENPGSRDCTDLQPEAKQG
jgi:hypothetical protein